MGDGDQSRSRHQKTAKSESWKGKNEARGKVPAELPGEWVCGPYKFFMRDIMLMRFDAGMKPGGSRSRWRVHSPSPSRRQLGAHQEGEQGVPACRAQACEHGVRSSCLHYPSRAHQLGRAKEENYLSL